MHKNLFGYFHWRSKAKKAACIFSNFQREIFFSLIVLMTTSVLIYFLTNYIICEKDNVIDYGIFLQVKKLVSPAGLNFANELTMLGTGNFLIPAYIFIIIYLENKNYRCLVYLTATTAVSSLLLGWVLKIIFHRSRPLEHLVSGAGGYSFPSGHALGGFIFCGIVLFLVWKIRVSFYFRWFISFIAVLISFGVGTSRIYLHVHYPTDVLGSFFIAIWWLSFMHIVFRLLFGHFISEKRAESEVAFLPNDYYLNN